MVLKIIDVVRLLEQQYGNSDWWPAETQFEVAVGAILTQRTSWRNAKLAIEALREKKMLTPRELLNTSCAEIEKVIRPSGFYKQKANYLIEFASYVELKYGGDISSMSRRSPEVLRQELIQLRGIGPETADAILLYALAFPSFVVDAYTTRVLRRLGLNAGETYDAIKANFESALGNDHARLANAHALMVVHCQKRCRPSPICVGCIFTDLCISKTE
ncbi:MAG: endonuclease [Methanobacteriota archaeon]|nr:MAG: endonuclease [Euryarchaeota archaeon]